VKIIAMVRWLVKAGVLRKKKSRFELGIKDSV